jgi:serine/threonine protein kinase
LSETLKEKKIKIEPAEFKDIFAQLANGGAHMASRGLIHMDLAARNVLVGPGNRCKLADFGMTRPFGRDGDFVQLRIPIKMAVKWGAPEAVHNLHFSEKTDVWSMGVTYWEVLSYG